MKIMLELIVALVLLVIWLVCDIIVYCKRKDEEQHYCLGNGGSRYAKKICKRVKVVVTVVAFIIILVIKFRFY